jgi:hypothetical protein|tara:strand:+ start:1105 stop:1875 length:771 start_codon:yes stop_codon:yes gene_type:complete
MTILRRPKQMKLKENLYASPGEFYYDDGKPFEGYYHMFDLNIKQYFEGEIYQYKARKIYPNQNPEFADPMAVNYTQAKRAAKDKKFEEKRAYLPKGVLPIITSKEIDKGEIKRFFVIQNNVNTPYEIDEEQYKQYKKASNPYNANFTVAQTSWFITGPLFSLYNSANYEIKSGIYERNRQQASIIIDEEPKMYPLVQDLLMFTIPDPAENLYSDGKILYLPGGQRFFGKYHVHPTKGPMGGSVHSSNTHPQLKIFL